MAASAVAGEKRSDALLIFAASAMLTGVATLTARIPAAEVGLLDRGDRICLHDDMSDPEHAVSVAYNLSREWTASDGGQTVFGDVIGVTPVDTPADAPFPLQQWHVRDERVFVPVFNSMLVMRLGARFAHGVSEVTSERSRLSLVAIYGRR